MNKKIDIEDKFDEVNFLVFFYKIFSNFIYKYIDY